MCSNWHLLSMATLLLSPLSTCMFAMYLQPPTCIQVPRRLKKRNLPLATPRPTLTSSRPSCWLTRWRGWDPCRRPALVSIRRTSSPWGRTVHSMLRYPSTWPCGHAVLLQGQAIYVGRHRGSGSPGCRRGTLKRGLLNGPPVSARVHTRWEPLSKRYTRRGTPIGFLLRRWNRPFRLQ